MSEDYIALEWVKGEIQDTLQQAQQSLEAYSENPNDAAKIKFCLSYLHQVTGTLQIVEFYGAELLAQEMEVVARSLSEHSLKNEKDGLQVLMQAIIQLPSYLEHVKVGKKDVPVVLLPTLNELRAVRGESLLSETALFNPRMVRRAVLKPGQLKRFQTSEFDAWIRKVRQMLQGATLQLIQGKNETLSIEYLNKVFTKLDNALGKAPFGVVWKPAIAYTEWLLEQPSLPSTTRQLLRDIDQQLKKLIDEGVEVLNLASPDALVRNLLFYVARTPVKGPAIDSVKEAFALDAALLTDAEVEKERQELAGPDKETVNVVLAALAEEIAPVKEQLELAMRNAGLRQQTLEQITPSVRQIADTLSMLGLGELSQRLKSELGTLMMDTQGTVQFSGIADVLVTLEGQFEDMVRDGKLHQEPESLGISAAEKAVLNEARNVLEQVKECIVGYVSNNWDAKELVEVPELLANLSGSLQVVSLSEAGLALGYAGEFAAGLIERDEKTDWTTLDNFADVLSGVEYFIERLSSDSISDGRNILDRVWTSLGKLAVTIDQEKISAAVENDLNKVAVPVVEDLVSAEPESREVLEDVSPQGSAEVDPFVEIGSHKETATPLIPVAESANAPQTAASEPEEDDDLIDDEIIEIFLEEAEEVLETLNEFWPKFSENNEDAESLTTVRRAFHTLKGSGRMVQANVIGELAWSIENMFNRLIDKTIQISPELVSIVDHVISILPALCEDFKERRRSEINTQPLMDYAFDLAANKKVPPLSGLVSDSAKASSDNRGDLAFAGASNLLEVFILEARGHLYFLRAFIDTSRSVNFTNGLTDGIQRTVHTLRGSAHMAGIPGIANVAAPLERMVKSFRSYLIPNQAELVDLMEAACNLVDSTLNDKDQLARGLVDLEGFQRYSERMTALDNEVVLPLVQNTGNKDQITNPKAIGKLFANGLDTLLDAKDQLDQWRHSQDSEILEIFCQDLEALEKGAVEAGQPPVLELARALRHLYCAVIESGDVSDSWLPMAEQGQDELLNMMDYLAAGQAFGHTELAREIDRFASEMEEAAVKEVQGQTRSSSGDQTASLRANLAFSLDHIEEVGTEESSRLLDAEIDGAHSETLFDELQTSWTLDSNVEPQSEPSLKEPSDINSPDSTLHDNSLETASIEAMGLEAVELSAPALADEEPVSAEVINEIPENQDITLELNFESGMEPSLELVGGDITPIEPPQGLETSAEEDDEITAIFLEEAGELLESASNFLNTWEQQPDNLLSVASLQRDLHTFKGGARMAEQNEVADLCHELETLYESYSEGRLSPPDNIFDLLHRCHDRLDEQVEQLNAGQRPEAASDLLAELAQLSASNETETRDFSLDVRVDQPDPVAETVEVAADASVAEAPTLSVPPPAAASAADDVKVVSLDESDREILEIFLEEASELAEALERALHDWEQNPADDQSSNEVQRVLHTLKGGARLAGLTDIGDRAHYLESRVVQFQQANVEPNGNFFLSVYKEEADLLKQIDMVADQLASGDLVILGEAQLESASLEDLVSESLETSLKDSDAGLEADIEAALSESDLISSDLVDIPDPSLTEDSLKDSSLDDLIGGDSQPPDILMANASDQALSDDAELLPVDASLLPASAPQTDTDTTTGSALDTGGQAAVPDNVVPLPDAKPSAEVNRPQPRKGPQELVKVSSELLDNLVNLAGETSIGRGRLEQQVTDFSGTLEEMDTTLDRLKDQLRRLDIETEAQVLFRQERSGPDYEDFDPLEMDRYSTIQQLSRALVESASDLLDIKDTLANKTRDAETLLLQQSRVNTELQEGLMKTRMVPFQRMVPRLRRIVRQISLELGKQVDFSILNAEGELDRSILERMISPLEHMVRNAVDHGIESIEDRLAAGKSTKGSVSLEVSRDGGDVVLTLKDDGRGINRSAVRDKAIERGLLSEDAEVTDHELLQFILQAGFSTAKNVTQISGRGVGLDVVNTEIKQLGGSLEILSEVGAGTRFVVRLPFTVSVNRALMVSVGEDLYAVPLNNIQGIVRVPVKDLQDFYSKPADQRQYQYADREYQMEYLGVLLENDSHPRFTTQDAPVPVLLVHGVKPFALQVDSLLGSREIVVKTLGPQFAAVNGISGGTILGDGSVVIILDVPAMIRTQTSIEYQQARFLDAKEAEVRQEIEVRPPKVMVVDDSVTVRKVTTRLLERHGMEVVTAHDGMNAIETLTSEIPDLILLDIEMPRMDGFEVASIVRHDSRLKQIPIIMITSRTGDKHRERAMSVGVNEYMGKPFQEQKLLGTINQLLDLEEA